jgi:oxygen-independent coproporphyrinogen-3 oxidase
MLLKGYDYITEHGYDAIGMDHFALPGDEMVKGYHSNTLHRNFQGYCTLKHTGQVYAFGASAISQMHGSYFQNTKDARAYTDSIEVGELPISKGYILNGEEKIIRRIINQLMCNGQINFGIEAQSLNISAGELKQLLDYSPGKFDGMKEDGLVSADEDMIRVTPLGMLLVRVIAKKLDKNYNLYQKEFSKTI